MLPIFKKTLLITLLGASFNTLAANAYVEKENDISINLIAGITTGGETLGGLEFTNGDSENVKAGGLLYLGAGVNIPIQESFSLQLNAAYHIDTATASNADVTFDRISLEAIAFYHFNEKFRLGLGVVQPVSASLELEDDFDNESIDFDADLGALIELGFNASNNSWWGIRYASINYQLEDDFLEEDIDGNYIGAFFTYGF